MSYRILTLVFLIAILGVSCVVAQSEVRVYAGRLAPAAEDAQNATLIGGEVFIGPRQLYPYAGVQYRGFSSSRLAFPLGLGYRIRPAHYSLNLLLSGGLTPVLSLGEEADEFALEGRLGGDVMVYPFTLGVRYNANFGERPGQWEFSAGVVF